MKRPCPIFRHRPDLDPIKRSLPPIPPEADRLAEVRQIIPPWQTYHITLPTGEVLKVSGADLIRDAENMLTLVKAQRAGDEEGMRHAVRRIMTNAGDRP